MKILLLGHTGFVGQAIYRYLRKKNYTIEGLNRSSLYYPNRICDIVINCAGNSKKYLVDKDYNAARWIEEGILENLQSIVTKRIIHISSIDAEEHSNYGSLKRFVEQAVRNIYSDFCILRLGGLVGERLSKNVVYDLLNDIPLRLTLDSVFNFIHTSTVAEIVEHLIKNWKSQEIINVAANRSISVGEISKMMKKIPSVRETAITEDYQIDTHKLQMFFETKDSKYYLTQYLKDV